MADNGLFLVFANAVPGRQSALDEWYDSTHVPDVLSVPGVVTAQRYTIAPLEVPDFAGLSQPTAPAHRYLTVYELSRDGNEVMAEFLRRVGSGAMPLSDALDMSSIALSVWRPLGERKFAPRIADVR